MDEEASDFDEAEELDEEPSDLDEDEPQQDDVRDLDSAPTAPRPSGGGSLFDYDMGGHA